MSRTAAARRPFLLNPVSMAVCLLGAAPLAHGLPQGAQQTFGQASVQQTSPAQLNINQSTDRAGIDWRSFSIGANERVVITQPGARSVLLNRVTGDDPSQIYGQLSANGSVWLINPRGIVFGANSRVDVGSLVASTLLVRDEDVASGRILLGRGSGGAGEITADGQITALGGNVLLAAPVVNVGGRIDARNVALAAATDVQVDVEGDRLVLFNVRNDGTLATRLSLLGRINADGGSVEMRAAARAGFADTVLNLDGVVQARSIGQRNGRIVIDGGSDGITRIGGSLDASGRTSGERGGDVQVTGQKVLLDNTAAIDASGAAGGGRVRLGGGFQGHDAEVRNAEMLIARSGATVKADALEQGDGGQVVLWSDRTTRFAADISARGGAAGGDGGNVEVSGKQSLDFAGVVDLRAPSGTAGRLLLDPADITIGSSGDTLALSLIAWDDSPSSFTAASVSTVLDSSNLTLQATNSITVSTAVSGANKLTLESGGNIDINANVTAGGGITLAANNTFTTGSSPPAPTGTGRVKIADNVTLDATGANVVISNVGSSTAHSLGGTIKGNALTLSGSAALTQNVSWQLNAGASSVANAISGGFGITKTGAGTLTLNGANTYTGTTTVSGGTLQLGAADRLADTSSVVVNGTGTLNLGGFTDTVAGVQLAASGASISNGTLTSTSAFDLQAGSVSAALGGSAGANKTTGGTVTLSGNNGYTGATTVSAGTLQLGAADRLADTSTLVVNGTGTFNLGGFSETVAGVQLAASGASITNGTLTSASAFDLQAGSVGAVLGGSAGANKTGSGTVTLNGNNTYTGVTTVSAGTLQLGAASRLADTSTLVVNGTGTFDLGGFSETVAGVQLAASGASITDGTLTSTAAFDLQAGSTSSTAVLAGTAGATKSTSGTVTLNGANTYSGVTAVDNGTLAVNHASALGASGGGNGTTLGSSGGTPVLQIGTGITLAEAVTTQNDGGSIVGNGAGATLSGTLTIGAATSLGGTLAVSGDTAGAGALAIAATASVTLSSAASSYSGDITVNSGANLTASSANALGNDTGRTIVASGGVLTINTASIGTEKLTLAGSGIGNGGAIVASVAATADGDVTLSADASIGGGDLTLNGRISGSGFGLTKATSGTLTLGGSSDYTGTTTVSAGTVALGANNRLDNASTLVVSGSGTFDLGGFNETVGGVRLAGAGASITNGRLTSTTAFDLQAGSTSASAVLDGNVGATKSTSGTVTLNGANGYTGTTAIDAGTLVANDAHALGTTAGGTTLGSSGSTAALQIGNGVTLADAVATQNLGGTITGNGATSKLGGDLTIGGPTTLAGTLEVQSGSSTSGSAALTIAAAADITISSASSSYSGDITVNATAALTAAGAGALGTSAGSTTVASGAVLNLNTPTIGAEPLTLGGTGIAASGVIVAVQPVTSTGPVTLTSDVSIGSGDLTLNGNIGGVGFGLTKATSGTLTLGGVNTYTGTTTVSAGTLTLGTASERLANASTLVVDGTGTLDLGGFTETVAGVQLASATASITNGTLISTSAFDLQAGSVSAALGGSAGASKTTGGTVTLSGNNSYTGATTVSAGTLALGAANERLADTSTVVVNGTGTLDLGGFTETVGGVQLAASGASITNGTLTSTTAFDLQAGTVGAVLGGSAGANKTTAGSVTLNGNNTYTGATTVSAGTLLLGAAERLANAGTVVVSGTGTLDLGGFSETVAGVRLAGTGASITNGTLTSTSAFDLQAGSTTASAVLDGSVGATKSTSGTVTLNGANTYTGTTAIDAGTLIANDAQALGAAATTLGSSGSTATLQFANGVTLANAVTTQNLGGTITGGGATAKLAGTLTIGAPTTLGGTLELTGDSAGSGAMSIASGGAVTLSSGASTYSGDIDVAAGGALTANSASALGTSAGRTAVASGGRLTLSTASIGSEPLRLAGTGISGSGAVVTTTGVAASGTVTLTADATFGDGDLTLSGAVGDGGSAFGITKNGTGTLTLGGNNTYTGTTTLTAGTIVLGASERLANASSVVVNGGTLNLGGFSETVNGVTLAGGTLSNGTLTSATAFNLQSGSASAVLAGTAGASKTTGGSVTLSGNNTYTGTTTISAGTLVLGANERLANAGSLVISGTGLLDLGGFTETVNGVQFLGSGSVTNGTLTSATDFDLQSGSTSSTAVLAGTGSSVGANKTTSGTFTLNGIATYSSTTRVTGGTLVLGADERLPDSGRLQVVGSTAVVDLGGHTETVDTVSISAGGSVINGTLNNTGPFEIESGTISSLISGSGGVIKTTTGTATLTHANTYSGLTQVNEGTLIVGNAGALGATGAGNGTTVASGATLQIGAGIVVTSEDVSISGSGAAGQAGALTGGGAGAQLNGAVTLAASSTLGGTLSLGGVVGGGAGATATIGGGSVTLAGVNTYSGETVVKSGATLIVSNASALGATTAGTTVESGGVLQIGGVNIGAEPLKLAGTGISGSGALVATGSATASGPVTLLDDTTIGSGNLRLDGTLSDGASSFALTKSGSGTLTLAVSPAYDGLTTVSGGTLAAGAALTFTGGVVVDGGSFDIGANNVALPSLQLLAGGVAGTTGVLTSAAAIDAQGGTISAVIGGSTALTKTGSGTVTLSGANTTTGTTTVSAGTLALGTANERLADTSSIVVDGTGTLNLGGFTETVAVVRLAGSGASISNGTLFSTSAFDLQAGSTTSSAVLAGTAGANKTTSGSVTLGGSNTYTGTTTVSAGTLALGAAERLANAGTLVVSGSGSFDLGGFSETLAGVRLAGAGASITNGTLVSSSAFDLQAGSTTSSAVLAGAVGATKSTSGTVTLAGASTYTGTTAIDAGTLVANNAQALGSAAAGTTLGSSGSSATLQIANGVTLADAVATQNLGGTISGAGATSKLGGTLTIGAATTLNGTLEISGATAGSGTATLAAGTLTLSGTSNSHGGDFIVTPGTTLVAASSGALGSAAGRTIVQSGGLLTLSAANQGSRPLMLAGTGIANSGAVVTTVAATNSGSVTLAADTTIGNGSLTLNGAIGDAGAGFGLTKDGSGTLTLGGANTFTGATTVASGTVALGASERLAGSIVVNGGSFDLGGFTETVPGVRLAGGSIGNGTLVSTSAFDLQSGSTTASAVLGGSAGARKTGSGTVTLNGSNSYTGATTIDAGTLQLGTANERLADASTLVLNGGTLNLGGFTETVAGVRLAGGSISNGTLVSTTAFDLQSGDTSASAVLGGSVGANKTTAGTVVFGGSNSYTGTTTVSDGTLRLGADERLADASRLIVAGGTLNLGGFAETVQNVRLAGGTIVNGTLTSITAFDLQSGSTGTDAVLAGNAGATKTTTGTVTLAGTNTYTGDTIVSAGTLLLNAGQFSPNATVVVSDGTLDLGGATASVAGVRLLGGTVANGTLVSASAFDLQAGATASTAVLGGTAGANKTTAGTVTFGGVNTYTGLTTVSDGTLAMAGDGRMASAGTLAVTGGTFDVGGFAQTFAGVRLAGGTLANGTITSTSAFAFESGTAGAVLAGSAGATKTTAGTLTLNADNTYTGTTTVNAGTLRLGAAERLANGGTLVVDGGTFDLGGFAETVAGVRLASGTLTNGTLTSTSDFDLRSGTVGAVLTGSVGATKTTSGTVDLTAAATYGGATQVSSGTLALAAGSLLPTGTTATVDTGATLQLGGDTTIGALAIGGTLGGSGTLQASSYALTDGALISTPLGTGALTSAGTTQLDATAAAGSVQVSSGTLTLGSAGRLTQAPSVTVDAGAELALGGNETLGAFVLGGTLSGSGTLTSPTYTLRGGLVQAALAGGTLNVESGGTLNASAAVTQVNLSGGTLTMGVSGSFGAAPAFDIGSGTTFALNADTVLGTLAGGGTIDLGLHSLTTGSAGSSTFSGLIEGGGNLKKVGSASTFTLAGANTYGGATDIAEGTLALSGDERLANTTAVVVRSGATLQLGGTETVASLNLQGGTLGGSGTLIAATYTLAAGNVLADLGAGALASSGASTIAGHAAATTVDVSDTLTLGSGGRFSATPAVTVAANATLALGGNEAFGTLAGSGTVALGAATLSTGSGGDSTFAGTLAGSGGGLTKTGTSTFLLSGSNTFTGTTTVAAGTLQLAASGHLDDASLVDVKSGATFIVAGNETIGGLTLAGTLAGAGTLTAPTYVLDGGTANAHLGAGALTSHGRSTLNAVSDAGSVTVADGDGLILGAGGRLSALPGVNVAAGSSLTLGGNEAFDTLAGGGAVALGAATLTVGGAGGSSSFGGTIGGTGNLVKDGAGTFTLTGNNGYGGATTVAQGTLALPGSDALADASTVTVRSGATLALDGSDSVASLLLQGRLAGTGTLTAATYALDGGTLDANLGAGALTSTGTATINGLAGVTSALVQSGTLALGAADRLGDAASLTVANGATLQLNGNDRIADLTLSGTLAGSGTLTAATYLLDGGTANADLGTGALTSTGASTLAGSSAADSVAVNGGSLTLASGSRFGAAPAVTVAGGATLALGGDETFSMLAGSGAVGLGAATLTVANSADGSFAGAIGGSGAFVKRGSGRFTLTGDNSYSGLTEVAEGTLRIGDGGNQGRVQTSEFRVSGTLESARSDAVSFAQAISGSGGVTQSGSGTLTMTGDNKTYSGDTQVLAGRLATAAAESLSNTSALVVGAGARVELAGAETVKSAQLDTQATLALGGNLTAAGSGANDGALDLLGAVSAPANITLEGGRITASNAGNRWGGRLAVTARDELTLNAGVDNGNAINLQLGRVTAANGGRIDGGLIDIADALSVTGGNLLLVSDAPRSALSPAASGLTGKTTPANAQAAYAADVVTQQAAGTIDVAPGATLSIQSLRNGSVNLTNDANHFAGGVAVLSGPEANQPWSNASTNGLSVQSRVQLAGTNVAIGGAGIEADVVAIRADTLKTLPDARIVARLPFMNLAGTDSQIPGLTLELTDLSFNTQNPYGQTGGSEIAINVGSRSFGNRTSPGDAGWVTVLPKGGAKNGTSVILVGPSGAYTFFSDNAGKQGEIPVVYNGVLPATPQVAGSIAATVAVSEGARKERFEEAIRTENVAVRLRAGVIAEVGPGRPATIGTEGVQPPASCAPSGATLACENR